MLALLASLPFFKSLIITKPHIAPLQIVLELCVRSALLKHYLYALLDNTMILLHNHASPVMQIVHSVLAHSLLIAFSVSAIPSLLLLPSELVFVILPLILSS